MVLGVGFCEIKVDSNFLLVLKIKCTKFRQDRSKTVDLHTKYTNKQTFSFIYIDYLYYLHSFNLYFFHNVSILHSVFSFCHYLLYFSSVSTQTT
jgi:hypothetical protein